MGSGLRDSLFHAMFGFDIHANLHKELHEGMRWQDTLQVAGWEKRMKSHMSGTGELVNEEALPKEQIERSPTDSGERGVDTEEGDDIDAEDDLAYASDDASAENTNGSEGGEEDQDYALRDEAAVL
jgi:hypothetical protein